VNDLDDLIQQAAIEKSDLSESGTDDSPNKTRFNQPVPVLLSWCLCLLIVLFVYLYPLPDNHHIADRSAQIQMRVAMYHLAHRIETYREVTGKLPEFIEPEWHESQSVEYKNTADGYLLRGRKGEFGLIYHEGDDPEQLIQQRSLENMR
jgi:hypothetical protein